MKNQFTGPMGKMMKRYLVLHRSFGLALKTADGALNAFDQYLTVYFPKTKQVTREMVVGYLETIRHLRSTSRWNQLVFLRQFCRFLFHLDPKTYIPEKNLLPPPKTERRPHIYNETELRSILRLAHNLGPSRSLRPHTFTTVFSLLWVSGMRISEVLNLNLGDVDLETGVIHIRKTKFLKSRLVPLSLSSTEALRRYLKQRAKYGHSCHSTAPFFINRRGKQLGVRGIQHGFCDVVEQLGIKTSQGRRPRIHDFRHSFATRWLNEIYKSGKDPTAYLPILATYLGHANVSHTQVYLHTSLELLQTAGRKFSRHAHQS